MARFDLHQSPAQGATGYVLDVQADLLRDLGTQVVAPLLPPEQAPKGARQLNPTFEISSQSYLMRTQFIAAVSTKELRKSVLSLEERSDDITRALDRLLVEH